MMILHALNGNSQMLDGGAMFGNAPKAMWEKWVKPDAHNRIPLSCRCFLLQEKVGLKRNILLETGVGAFFEPKLKSRFGVVEGEHILLNALQEQGLTHTDIDVVILSHLHFDHAGGLLSVWSEEREPELLFPNARYVTSERAWERARKPHPRDRASFLPTLNQQLEESGRLHLIEDAHDDMLGDAFQFHYVDGHTPGMLLTEFLWQERPVVFAADLIPGVAWVHVPITMGYDRFPECVINEKQSLLEDLYQRNGGLLFTHDAMVDGGWVTKNERNRFAVTPFEC